MHVTGVFSIIKQKNYKEGLILLLKFIIMANVDLPPLKSLRYFLLYKFLCMETTEKSCLQNAVIRHCLLAGRR